MKFLNSYTNFTVLQVDCARAELNCLGELFGGGFAVKSDHCDS